MYQELLKEAAHWLKTYDRKMQPPCSEEALENLRQRAQSNMGASIPEEYAAFLRIANGFDWNGCVIYACETTPIAGYSDRFIQGFVEANLTWRDFEPNKDFLFFGDGDISLYGYNVPKGEYQVRDRQSDTLIKVVPSFEALVAEALQEHRFTKD